MGEGGFPQCDDVPARALPAGESCRVTLEPSRPARRALRRQHAADAARDQGGLLGLKQLYALGFTRWEVEAERRAGVWSRLGRQSVSVAPGDAQQREWWRALLEVSPSAVLDGISALVASGLRHVEEDAVHVAVPKSGRPRRCKDVQVHETRRYEQAAVLRDGVPRMRPATAAVHAALWARTDRQAALYVIAAAQQRLFTADELLVEIDKIRRHARRKLLQGLHLDVLGGIEAMGERDFARLCAERGFPVPSRQVTRRTSAGRVVFDTVWDDFGLTVEIDGIQHLELEAWFADALKQNEASMSGHTVLRVPSVALRVAPAPFMDQVAAALRRGGWIGRRRRTA